MDRIQIEKQIEEIAQKIKNIEDQKHTIILYETYFDHKLNSLETQLRNLKKQLEKLNNDEKIL